MSELPYVMFHPGMRNNENQSVRPQGTTNVQCPGNVPNVQPPGAFQQSNPSFMRPPPFFPNVNPPHPTQHARVPPNLSSCGGPRPDVLPYVQGPQWPPHWRPNGPSLPIQHPAGPPSMPSVTFNKLVPPPSMNAPQLTFPREYIPNQGVAGGNLANALESPENYGRVSTEAEADRRWIDQWLRYHGKGPAPQKPSTGDAKGKLKVWEVKQLLQSSMSILGELEALEEELTTKCQELGEDDWNCKMEEVELQKARLRGHLDELDEEELRSTKMVLSRRKKKRSRERRRRTFEKENAVSVVKEQKKLHLAIDMWLEKKQGEVDLQKREEAVKQEADAVLWEVRRKQSEGRRVLSLLSVLVQLYCIRCKRSGVAADPAATENDDQFQNIIDKLVTLWERQMKDYEAEERALRVMLQEGPEGGDAAVSEVRGELSRMERIHRQWEALLFGGSAELSQEMVSLGAEVYKQFYLQPSKSLDAFIETRRHWDQFISTSLLSSQIPVGWVVPKEASSEGWKAFVNPITEPKGF